MRQLNQLANFLIGDRLRVTVLIFDPEI